jgi:hypothetical protein
LLALNKTNEDKINQNNLSFDSKKNKLINEINNAEKQIGISNQEIQDLNSKILLNKNIIDDQ